MFSLNRTIRSCTFWRSDCSAVAAIEFSLMALPFILLVIGIMELSLMFAADSLLHGAVSDAARLVRTGQIQQTDGDPEQMFTDALCHHAGMLLNCDRFQYEVHVLDRFDEADLSPVFDEDGNMASSGFDPGGVREIVLIRVSYLYPLMTPMIGNFFADYPGNQKLLLATTVLETEPYAFQDS